MSIKSLVSKQNSMVYAQTTKRVKDELEYATNW